MAGGRKEKQHSFIRAKKEGFKKGKRNYQTKTFFSLRLRLHNNSGLLSTGYLKNRHPVKLENRMVETCTEIWLF